MIQHYANGRINKNHNFQVKVSIFTKKFLYRISMSTSGLFKRCVQTFHIQKNTIKTCIGVHHFLNSFFKMYLSTRL